MTSVPTPKALEQLKRTYQQDGLALCVGAGLSARSAIPDWERLLGRMLETLPGKKSRPDVQRLKASGMSLESLAQYIESEHAKVKKSAPWAEFVREQLYRDYPFRDIGPTQPGSVRKFLTQTFDQNQTLASVASFCVLPWRKPDGFESNPRLHAILNFNFDTIFRYYVGYGFAARSEKPILATLVRDDRKQGLFGIPLYHVHGNIRPRGADPLAEGKEQLVFTEQEYFRFVANPLSRMSATCLYLLGRYSFLFIGCSMTDANLRRMLYVTLRQQESAQGTRLVKRHFAIIRRDENVGRQAEAAFDSTLDQLGVRVIRIDAFDEIPRILAGLYGSDWPKVFGSQLFAGRKPH